MRTVGTKLVGLAVTSVLVAGPAFATSDVDNDLAEMRAVVDGLKQKVDAQQEQIEHQSGLLQDAQKTVREQQKLEQGTQSGMADFWKAIDVNMSVAGSYAYNFNDPRGRIHAAPGFNNQGFGNGSGRSLNTGHSGGFYPFNPDHNSFQVDQVWFDIGKKVTAESRAGFHATILYGTTAAFLGQGSPFHRSVFDSTSDLYVNQAYVEYLAPIAPEGLDFTFGKFATLVGAEVADASKNWAITRGNLYTFLQPIDHLGLMGSTTFGPVSVAGAVVNQNNFKTSSPDINSEKSYIAKIGFGGPTDAFTAATTVLYGAEGPSVGVGSFGGNANARKTGLVDLLANYTSDAFSAYVNADYAWVQDRSPAAWGVSIAGKVPITEAFSAALRAEYLRDQATNFAFSPPFPSSGTDFFGILAPWRASDIYGLTGTLAYALAENLTLKGEVRWDRVVEADFGTPPHDEFFTNTSGGKSDQVVGLAQVIYAF